MTRPSRRRQREVKIWYFAPAFSPEIDAEIKSILKEIREKQGFRCRHIVCRGRDKQEELFKKHFTDTKTAYLLRQHTGKRINQLLRSRGGKGPVYLRGVIAVVEGGGPQWISSNSEALKALKRIRGRGVRAIDKLYQECNVITDEEAVLLDKLEAFDKRVWNLQRGVKVGKFFTEKFNTTAKFIDAVSIDDLNRHWVIEAERSLNHEAIGQAIVYEVLYRRDNPGVDIQKAIVCGEASADFLQVCKTNNIDVLIVKGEEVIDGLDLLNEIPDKRP